MRPTPVPVLIGAALLATGSLGAQETAPRSARVPDAVTRVYRIDRDADANRAALGLSTSSTGKRDTLGLLIESITPNSPADKAGLEEGDRIASINGVSLRLAPADAGEPEMDGLMRRRLVRELEKVKPGDEVTLEVYSGGATKSVKVKTASLGDLEGRRVTLTSDDLDNRPAIGISLGGGGSRRDTLGLLVVSVANNGPADKAGIGEGDRIQAIDGVDVRIPAADAESGDMVGAKEQRFTREVRKSKPGDVVELKVYSDGAVKTVKVTVGRSGDVYPRSAWRFDFGGDGWAAPMPPTPPTPPIPPMRIRIDGGDDQWPVVREDLDRARAELQSSVQQSMREARRATARARVELERVRADWPELRARAIVLNGSDASPMTYTWNGARAMGMIGRSGLHLSPVSTGLSSYFGAGSDKGLLVLDATDEWKPLRAGDVILSVNGEAVRDGDHTEIALDSDRDNTFLVLRKGAKMTVKVKAH